MAEEEEEFGDTPNVAASAPSLSGAPDPYVDYLREEKEREDRYVKYVRQPAYSGDLRSAYQSYTNVDALEPGQIVEWKPMMKNRLFPHYGAPAVVIGDINEPGLPSEAQPGDEPVDIQIGYLDGEQVFRISPASRARLKSWEG